MFSMNLLRTEKIAQFMTLTQNLIELVSDYKR